MALVSILVLQECRNLLPLPQAHAFKRKPHRPAEPVTNPQPTASFQPQSGHIYINTTLTAAQAPGVGSSSVFQQFVVQL